MTGGLNEGKNRVSVVSVGLLDVSGSLGKLSWVGMRYDGKPGDGVVEKIELVFKLEGLICYRQRISSSK